MNKNFRIEIEERAKIEISEAFDWYENQHINNDFILKILNLCKLDLDILKI